MADLFLSSTYDNELIVQLLRNAQQETEYRSLTFFRTQFTSEVALAMKELLECDDRHWERIFIQNCTCPAVNFCNTLSTAIVEQFSTVKLFGKPELENHLLTSLVQRLESRRCRVKNLSLNGFRLSKQDAAALEQGLRRNRTLEALLLFRVSMENLATFANGLKYNKSLQLLELRDVDATIVVEMTQALGTNRTLQSLSISGCTIQPMQMTSLATALQTTTARHLSLADNKLSDEAVYRLSDAWQRPTSIRVLDLSSNQIGDIGMVALSTSLSSLDTLILRNNPRVTDDGLTNLIKGLSWSSVRHLDLSENQRMWTMQSLKKGALVGLHSLNLSRIGLGDDAMIGLAKALSSSTVKELNLRCNQITDSGLMRFMETTNSSLVHLDLSENAIGDNGLAAMAAGLRNHPTLQHLDISDNQVGDAGANALCKSLSNRETTLKHVDLSGNRIQDEGIANLADMLRSNSSVKSLDVSWNALNDEAYASDAFHKALLVNTCLEQLEYQSSPWNTTTNCNKPIDYYLQLNRGGRKLLNSSGFPPAIWPAVLSRVKAIECNEADLIYFFLQQQGGEHRIL